MKTITIFGCWWGGNLGDTSILYSTIKNLPNENIKKIIVHSLDPKALQHYLQEFESVEIRKSVTNYWGARTVQSIRESDIIVIGGGGLLFSKRIHDPFYSHISNILPIVKIAKMFNVEVKLHAVGASHLDTKISKIMTRSILRHANSVTVRDMRSHEIVSNLGNTRPEVVSDPAFLLSTNTSDRVSGIVSEFDRPFITLSLHSDIDKYATVTKEEIAKNILRKVNNYAVNNKFDILLYNNYRNDDWLRTLSSQIHSEVEVKLVPPDMDLRPNEAVALLQASSRVIASQMHVNIMSIVARTPNVAIEYDEKVRSMMNQVELENQVVTIEDVCEKQILESNINGSSEIDDQVLERIRDVAKTSITNLV